MRIFCFIILHFKTYEITKRCIDSILGLDDTENVQIVVVDNASNDGSGDALINEYKDNEQVDVVIKKESGGFSDGNNTGYIYAIDKYNPDCMVMTNNDVIFEQNDFCQQVIKIYNNTKFDILGPDIVNTYDGKHCSPIEMKVPSLEETKKKVSKYRFMSKHVLISLLIRKFKYYFDKDDAKINIDYTKEIEGVVLWGACLIFSRSFFQKKDLPFYPKTQFYHEEEILFYQAFRDNMKVVYSPTLKVLHGHSKATEAAYTKKFDRKKFQFTNNYYGTKVYLEMLERDKERN